MDRIKESYFKLKSLKNHQSSLYQSWSSIIMHLPYAFQGRRMLSEIYALDAKNPIISGNETAVVYQNITKEVSKSEAYKNFVSQKLQPAELASSLIGDLYNGSIFMGFLSTLSYFYDNKIEIEGNTFGFMAYGSGSKSKVFEGRVQPEWKLAMTNVKLFDTLKESFSIDFETYEKMHKKEQKQSILGPKNEWILDKIENKNPNLLGARYYKWMYAHPPTLPLSRLQSGWSRN